MKSALTEEQVRGLLGELTILARCAGLHGTLAAVTAWRGPTGALRDFELPRAAVEVKTYQHATGSSVRINDPGQLEPSASRPVYLAAVNVSESDASGATLPDYVTRVSTLLDGDLEAAGAFADRLADYGYLEAYSEHYLTRYRVERVSLYEVRAGFPRIRPLDLQAGVVDVGFSLTLSALSKFEVDAIPIIGAALPGFEAGGDA